MQAVRRSERLRNQSGRRQFLENQSFLAITAPLENIQMGGDEDNISFHNSAPFDASLNPDMRDMLPDDESNSISYPEFPTTTKKFKWCLLKCLRLMMIASLISILLFSVEHIALNGSVIKREIISKILSKNYNYDAEDIKNYYSLIYPTHKLLEIERQIKQLNRRLEVISNALEETNKWRHEIKNETLQLTLNQFEKFNVIIQEALSLYDADKVGKTDYALESAGGYIISTPETTPFPSRFSYDLMGIVNIQYPSNPRMLINPETLPGQCFAFKGTRGRIRIGLAHVINISSITLEHAHPNLVEDITSAPKDFQVYALESASSEDRKELGSFTYRIKKTPLQTFYIDEINKDRTRYKYIELEIISNYGNPQYTCIYRFRAHGNKVV